MKTRPVIKGDVVQPTPFNDLMNYIHESNPDLRENGGTPLMLHEPFWAEITGAAYPSTSHPQMGYTWKEVIANYKDGDDDISWEFTGWDYTQADYAFEANDIAIGYTTSGAEVGCVVRIIPTINDYGISYVIFHSETQVHNVIGIGGSTSNQPPDPYAASPDQKEWDKFLGYSTDGGTTHNKRNGANRLYDGFQFWVVSSITACMTPRYRQITCDAQGHILKVTREQVYPMMGPP